MSVFQHTPFFQDGWKNDKLTKITINQNVHCNFFNLLYRVKWSLISGKDAEILVNIGNYKNSLYQWQAS